MPSERENLLSQLWVSSASGGKETKAIEWEEEQQVRTFPSLTCSSWAGARAGGYNFHVIYFLLLAPMVFHIVHGFFIRF